MRVGWIRPPKRYKGGGSSNGAIDRPALRRILPDNEAGEIIRVVDCNVNRPRLSIRNLALRASEKITNRPNSANSTQNYPRLFACYSAEIPLVLLFGC